MEIQKIFSEIDTEERIYSVLLSEEELALFSEISVELEQREFNSKAAKALNNKYLKGVAAKKSISVDPNSSEWKNRVRDFVRTDIRYPSGSREKFNKYLEDKAMGSASNLHLGGFTLRGRGYGKKEYKNVLLNEYDHDINNRLINDVGKRKTLVKAVKNDRERLAKHKQ